MESYRKLFVFLFVIVLLMMPVISVMAEMTNVANSTSRTEIRDIKILSVRGLYNPQYYIVFGEIYNSGEKYIKDVKIAISLIDASGKLVGKINASASLSVIPPKRRTPFIGYYGGGDKSLIQNVTIDDATYQYADERKLALTFIAPEFYNGTFKTHVLNNCTLAVGERIRTNNLKVVAALYAQDKIVGVGAGFLNLPDPGLLWDTDTTMVGSGEPITIDFAYPFIEEEVYSADKLVASVESYNLSAQYELIGSYNGKQWTWSLLYKEEIISNVGGSNSNGSWRIWLSITLIILIILVPIVTIIGYSRIKKAYIHKKRKKARLRK